MHNLDIDNYIFDMDGTLIDSSKEVLLCIKKAFEMANYKIDESRFNSDVIGPPLMQIMKILAPELTDEDVFAKTMLNFRSIYDNKEDDVSTMYDGVYDYLIELKKQNKKMFLATFKPQFPTMRLVQKFGLNEFFDDVYTVDKFGKSITKDEMIIDIIKQYELDKAKTVMIGDAANDVIAAKKAGIIGIGALWGYGEDKIPLKDNSDYTIDRIEDLKCPKLSYQTT